MFKKVLLYVVLSVFAAITLVPFAYMVCSAIKPLSVFFSSPFLPTNALFEIDASTGALSAVDVTLLPDDGQPKLYELEVARFVGDRRVSSKTITISVNSEEGDFVVPADAKINTALGRVELPGPEATGGGAGLPSGDTAAQDTMTRRLEARRRASAQDVAGADPGGGADAEAKEGKYRESIKPAPAGEDVLPDDAVDTPAATGGFTTVSYQIVEGNERGLLGRAWGLLTLNNFDRLFTGVPPVEGAPPKPTGVWRAIVNSLFFASVSSVLATLGAAMGGYALAKFRFRGRKSIDNLVLAALVIPGALLIAPGYQLLYWLGMLDSYAGLILPGIAPAFGVFLFRQAMITSLPDEMIEAARIDGCGEIKMFFIMALPMVRPMAGAFLMITYLGAWNNFIAPQIVLQTPEKYPLAVWIAQLRGVYGIDYGLIMAGTLVAIAPVLILFLMLQKEFIAGLTAGAVKG